jgi:hypothetical protein
MGICGVEVGSVGSFVAGELQSGENREKVFVEDHMAIDGDTTSG